LNISLLRVVVVAGKLVQAVERAAFVQAPDYL
jgi:hypothetical protein